MVYSKKKKAERGFSQLSRPGPMFGMLVTLWLILSPDPLSGQRWYKDEDKLRQIDSLCWMQMDSGHFPGMAVAVAYGKNKIWTDSYGYADIAHQTPIDPQTHLFRIGSISKAVTGATMARLWQQGKLNLDQPISNWYTACPTDKRQLTLRQLGGHLGGIRHYKDTEFLSNIHYANVEAPLDVFIHDTLLCVPGTQFNYSTYGWTLISAVMEMQTQIRFTDQVHQEVNIPLALDDLRPDQKDSTHWPRVIFYNYTNGRHIPGPEVDNSNKWAGGGYLCTAEDVARFGWAHVGPGYLHKEAIDLFTTSQQTTSGEKTGYGIGYNDQVDDRGRKWIGHSGGSIGGSSMLLIYPEEDLVVVTLVNLTSAQMNQLAFKIADIILEQ